MARIEFLGHEIAVVGEGAAALADVTGLGEEAVQVVSQGGYQQQEQQQQQEGSPRSRHSEAFGGNLVVVAAIAAGEGAVPVHLMSRTR